MKRLNDRDFSERIWQRRKKLLIVQPDLGVQLLLNSFLSKTYEIVDIVNNGYAAVDAAFNLEPDLVLIDIDMSGLDGITATEWLKQGDDIPKVVAFGSSTNFEEFMELMKAGADGYCLKGGSLEELKTALTVVGDGATFLSSGVKNIFRNAPKCESLKEPDLLSSREKDILKCVIDRKHDWEISSSLDLEKERLKIYLDNIKKKLQIKNNRKTLPSA